MARNFGREDASRATSGTLDNITRTPTVRAFLDHHDKRYIVGPKGSGKTLVLLRKAIDTRERGGAIWVPSDAHRPVDRLDAVENVGQRFFFSVNQDDKRNLAWTSVWKHSILRSAIHHCRDALQTTPETALALDRVDRIIDVNRGRPLRPFEYYRDITLTLDESPRKTLSRIRDELFQLDELLQLIDKDVFVFLDNLDDYYELAPDLWMQSMYGQLRAIRELSFAHSHLLVFTSIRQDVYTQFKDEMSLQYSDYIAELRYSGDDLVEIFESRIRELDDDLLEFPELRTENPWKAFFGTFTVLRNDRVGDAEDIRQYIVRHTLGRPRDIVHIGTELLSYRPESGFTLQSIRDAVADAAEDICQQYISEIRPLTDSVRLNVPDFVANYVHSNILDKDELDEIRDEYRRVYAEIADKKRPMPAEKPFAVLYDLGLLGVERRRNGDAPAQSFRLASHGLNDCILPRSEKYFLHPVLSYPYLQDYESQELIVGNGLSSE